MSELELRAATTADEEFLFEVYATTREREMAVVPWTDEQKVEFLRFQSRAQLAHYRQHYHGAEYWIIVLDGADIGRIFIQEGAGELRIMEMSLLPQHRAKGLGSALMTRMLKRADDSGLTAVLHVESFNPALRLYERFGFVDDGELSIYRRMIRPAKATA